MQQSIFTKSQSKFNLSWRFYDQTSHLMIWLMQMQET